MKDKKSNTLEAEMAQNLRKKKTPLFTTCASIDEIVQRLDLKGEAVIAVMMAVNTTLELTAREIENGNLAAREKMHKMHKM